MKRKFYVAYGSNLNIEQMMMRCPEARIAGTGMIDGFELLYKGSKTGAYLTIEMKEGSQVPVGIWSVTEADEEALDRYEGFPTFYYKAEMKLKIRTVAGKQMTRTCFVYIMHEDRPLGIPARRYVDTCLTGYEEFGFDSRYLLEAEKKSVKGAGKYEKYQFTWF